MKESTTTFHLVFRFSLFILFLLGIQPAFAQQGFLFRNALLESGQDGKAGAVYRFPSVINGIDARLTIRTLSGGVRVLSIDEPTSSGYHEALQPLLSVPGLSSGYIELQLDFYQAGSSGSGPVALPEIPVTAIDLDADNVNGGKLYNSAEFLSGNSVFEYDYATPHVSLINSSPQGEWLIARNKSGQASLKPDTTVLSMMTSVLYHNTTSVVFRIGVQNTSSLSGTVLRSFYFKKFTYPRINILPNRTLLSFAGSARPNNTVELNGILSASHTYNKILIEKKGSAEQFIPVGEINVSHTGTGEYLFSFTDPNVTGPVNFYRARLLNTQDRVMETGNILAIKRSSGVAEKFKLVNTVIPVAGGELIINSPEREAVELKLVSVSGVILSRQVATLFAGNNTLRLKLNSGMAGHMAFLQLTTSGETLTQKVWLQ